MGYARATENVTITNCQVSGYDEGTLLDGTYKREFRNAERHLQPDRKNQVRHRIERRIQEHHDLELCLRLLSRARFGKRRRRVAGRRDHLKHHDARHLNSPFFLRLGGRMRGPQGATVGALRRVMISNVIVYNAEPKYASIISGIPGHDIEDVTLNNIRIYYKGGGTKEQAALQPPEKETTIPSRRCSARCRRTDSLFATCAVCR